MIERLTLKQSHKKKLRRGCGELKVIFMGTPDFAVKTLKSCIENFDVIGVFTQPDKPKGRGKKMMAPPVKVIAEAYGIQVFQPNRIRENQWVAQLKTLAPDLIVVVAYGQILPKEILEIPKYGCINVHGSLLPQYRGAAPIQWAVANGDTETGITTMLMDTGLDTGDMLLKKSVPIPSDSTSQEIHDILAEVGAALLIETVEALKNDQLLPIKQRDDEATYAPMLDKKIAKIDWSLPAERIESKIRGFNPWPVAHTILGGETLKVFKATIGNEAPDNSVPGTILYTSKEYIAVATGNGVLQLLEIQLGSHRRMAVKDFLLGREITTGIVLGEE